MTKQAVLNGVTKLISRMAGRLSGNSIGARCARGSVTLGAGVALERALRLFRYIVLARLLAPDEFGLMAIVLVAMLLFETAFEVGVKQSVIQNKRGAEPEYLNVAWWFQAARGSALFIAAFLAAPLVRRIYGEPELSTLLRVALLALVFKGLMSPRVHVLEKKFQFQKVVILTQVSSLFGSMLTIVLAFFLRNIWALVIGFVSESFLQCLLSFVLCPFLPRFKIERGCLSEVARFARGMFGLSILATIAFEIDILVLGKLVPMAMIGIYSMARRLAQTPKELYMRIFGPILLAAFSEKQDDHSYLCRAVLKTTKATAMFGIPLAGFCVVCAGAILSIVFGSQYAAVTVPFGLLSVCTLVRTQGISLASIYLALGRPHLHRGFVALRATILVLLIYPAITFFGPAGAAAVVLLAELISLCVQTVWMRKQIGLRLSEYMLCWLPGLALAQIVVVPTAVLKFLQPGSLIANVAAGGGLCLLACMLGLALLRGWPKKLEPARAGAREVEMDFEVGTKYA